MPFTPFTFNCLTIGDNFFRDVSSNQISLIPKDFFSSRFPTSQVSFFQATCVGAGCPNYLPGATSFQMYASGLDGACMLILFCYVFHRPCSFLSLYEYGIVFVFLGLVSRTLNPLTDLLHIKSDRSYWSIVRSHLFSDFWKAILYKKSAKLHSILCLLTPTCQFFRSS